MNGEVQITDLVISKFLRQNIEKYRSLLPYVAAAIRLKIWFTVFLDFLFWFCFFQNLLKCWL